jgi:hypothetical protein
MQSDPTGPNRYRSQQAIKIPHAALGMSTGKSPLRMSQPIKMLSTRISAAINPMASVVLRGTYRRVIAYPAAMAAQAGKSMTRARGPRNRGEDLTGSIPYTCCRVTASK